MRPAWLTLAEATGLALLCCALADPTAARPASVPAVASPASQPPAGQEPPPPVPAYRRIVRAYSSGATSRAVADLLTLTRADIEESVGPLERISASRSLDDNLLATGWTRQEIGAASLLHIETAGRLAAIPADFDWHLVVAIRLLRLEGEWRERGLPEFVMPAAFRRDGLLAVVWQLESLRALDTLARGLTLLEADFPGDAEVLLAKGSAFEAQAWALLPSQADGLGGPLPGGAEAIGAVLYGPRRGLLREAESAFRRALDADRSMTEPRLRLGRVVGLQGRHAEALEVLDTLLAQTRDPWTAYLAHLFAGASAEALGRLDEAIGHFTDASTARPRSQPARVALSHALRVKGDQRAALARALDVTAFVPDEADEPWWEYHFGQLRLLEGRLNRLLAVDLR